MIPRTALENSYLVTSPLINNNNNKTPKKKRTTKKPTQKKTNPETLLSNDNKEHLFSLNVLTFCLCISLLQLNLNCVLQCVCRHSSATLNFTNLYCHIRSFRLTKTLSSSRCCMSPAASPFDSEFFNNQVWGGISKQLPHYSQQFYLDHAPLPCHMEKGLTQI